ncbi:tRNA uridine-5-carboxymethylaminomethyl(34) synthesis GTPase MnmE [Granulicella arctica]|uniref:tRNA uridine-5-carboxymethylaminomethyl(34) synthesis GTPase MnmE n=1 Tax=Granulicella arctica TaxID=940613 RepID=UPI0021E0644E|nr:tRNA uridine-5-carboxymethylaminomethyl(34) synthesis GTPase MnmE [Granulicella arctica]
MDFEQDTIVAVATPPGRGGIGIVRLSGPAASTIVAPLLRLRRPLAAGRARFAEILEVATGEPLDEAVVTFFAAPRSYTGEDVVEIAAHGSPVLMDYLLRQCAATGARLAEAGEFTQRAFLAGRLDLTQAEAVADLIDSSTLEQARVAARQLGGGLARQIQPAKEALVLLIAGLEAGIDFAEDDIELMAASVVVEQISAIMPSLAALERSFAYGRILREGFRMALVGRPNAGKSSLFNRLLEQDRSIVTAMPGTTRDVVAERMSLGGIPVELMDTAGLRTAHQSGYETAQIDEAEGLGITRSRQAMAEAEVLLLVIDATLPLDSEDEAVLRQAEARTLLVVLNKIDLSSRPTENQLPLEIEPSLRVVHTSALTGDGIDTLRQAISDVLHATAPSENSNLLTNLRQHQAISQTLASLERAKEAARGGLPHEMLLLDLYEALHSLDGLTGATTSDDILHLIFGRFCIGK